VLLTDSLFGRQSIKRKYYGKLITARGTIKRTDKMETKSVLQSNTLAHKSCIFMAAIQFKNIEAIAVLARYSPTTIGTTFSQTEMTTFVVLIIQTTKQ
jgi:hypothetical protein